MFRIWRPLYWSNWGYPLTSEFTNLLSTGNIFVNSVVVYQFYKNKNCCIQSVQNASVNKDIVSISFQLSILSHRLLYTCLIFYEVDWNIKKARSNHGIWVFFCIFLNTQSYCIVPRKIVLFFFNITNIILIPIFWKRKWQGKAYVDRLLKLFFQRCQFRLCEIKPSII